ncbi:MAG: small multi-drug export protein [Clostridia bacterium]|nr:small multi-drug export protein [Clostridia bacterium]
MTEAISNFFLNIVGKELCVFFCAMLPVIELRGAIPLGTALGLPIWETFLLALAGNLFPVPFILLLIRFIISLMKKIPFMRRFAEWLERKAEKNREKVEKAEFWGLLALVAIPLPGTGAWTGSLVAAVLNMKYWKSLLSIVLGVLIAGVLILGISYGVAAIVASAT